MDTKDLKGLMEAYSEVYAPQEELDEGYQEPRLDRKAFVKHANKRSGFSLGTREDPHGWREPGMEKVAKEYAARTSSARRAKRTGKPDTYRAEKESQSKLRKEEVDIFDVVLEFLQAEGYAETLEEAEWLMANELDAEDIEAILEAEGSYGQTPKARQAMGKLAIARREKPASEYSQKGEKTKKVKEIEKHTRRIDNGPDVGNRGKKSTKPRWASRGKMDQDSRDYARDRDVEYSAGGNKPGSGSVTKNPKKLRKQKAMGEHD